MVNDPKYIDVSKAKVLLVDDTPANLDVLRKVLTPEGYKLSFANRGEKALQIVDYAPPDLILLDVMMPGMDGLEVCRRLKAKPVSQEIPVIFITAKSDMEDMLESFRVGAVDHIIKPFRPEEVCIRVRTHLQTQLLLRQRESLIHAQQATEKRFRLLATCLLEELQENGEMYKQFAENLAQRLAKYDLEGMLTLLEQLEGDEKNEEPLNLKAFHLPASLHARLREAAEINDLTELEHLLSELRLVGDPQARLAKHFARALAAYDTDEILATLENVPHDG